MVMQMLAWLDIAGCYTYWPTILEYRIAVGSPSHGNFMSCGYIFFQDHILTLAYLYRLAFCEFP
jgi:hypothetical protein